MSWIKILLIRRGFEDTGSDAPQCAVYRCRQADRSMKQIRLFIAVLAFSGVVGCAMVPDDQEQRDRSAAEANADLGLRYMVQGNYEVAMAKLQRAIEYNEESPRAHHYLAELYRRLERYPDADDHFQKAIKFSTPKPTSDLLNNYGVFLCDRERFEEAESYFLKVFDDPIYTGRAQVFENLGLCMQRNGEPDKAEEYFRNALKINPKLSKTLGAMIEISFVKGNHLSARAYLQRYLEVARHTPQTLWLGIRAERILGDKNAVASYGLLLEQNFPDSEEARLYQETQR